MDTLQARQATRAYGEIFSEAAFAPWRTESALRRITQEIAGRAPPLGVVKIVVEVGARSASMTLAPGAEIEIGSGHAVALRVDDPTVSGRHCRVAHAGVCIEVTDLGARNGVRVGGVRVTHAELSLGSTCELGRASLRVEPSATPARDERPLRGLIGASRPMRKLAASVRRLAPLRLPALLRGESGTGKDLVARALHEESPRAGRPFVVLNAAAITRELAESELFGHERGAFTGAVRDRRGAFREAHGGTLFLDEIGAVPLEVQAKLLRAVEEGVVRPVGGEASAPVDVRLVVATCEPLEQMVAERRFRGDLYERLAVCVVQVPALRERIEDLPALVRHLLATSEMGDRKVAPDAMAALRAHRWPGNVRELRNVIVQAAVRAPGAIEVGHVAEVLDERVARARRITPEEAVQIWEEAGRNVSAAARLADLPRSTMRDLLRTAAGSR